MRNFVGKLIVAAADILGIVPVASGGTGSSSASGARSNLGLGTIATQDSSSITGGNVNITGAYSVNSNRIIYFPAQATFAGTLFIGTGGVALSHTTGSEANNITAVGVSTLSANTTGANGTAVGAAALTANTTGNNNTAFGRNSLVLNTTGGSNVGVGASSLSNMVTGSSNTAVGNSALLNLTTSSTNVGIGANSGRFITDGSTANMTSGTSVYLGNDTKALADGGANEIVLGYNAIGAGSNTATLGNTSITSTVLRGRVNLGARSRTAGYLVSALPSSPLAGDRAYVTDALTPVFGSTVVGGGAVNVPVFYNSSNWIVG